MKNTLRMLLLLLVGSLLLAGCGQKGDLYLPDQQNSDKHR